MLGVPDVMASLTVVHGCCVEESGVDSSAPGVFASTGLDLTGSVVNEVHSSDVMCVSGVSVE